jgi:hypothetical protein
MYWDIKSRRQKFKNLPARGITAGSVNAQTTANPRATTTVERDTTRTIPADRDNDHDRGWIGLLGLLGLAGLMPKKRINDHDHIDTGKRTTTR